MDNVSLGSWLEELADRTPTPGGGAAAALCAATSAALISMVSTYTTGARWADREERMRGIHAEAVELRVRALSLAAADAVAFAQVGAAYGLPRSTDDEKRARSGAIQAALVGAARPPVDTGTLAARLVELAEGLVKDGNPNVISDVAVAASAAAAALESAIVNIEINASQITDAATTGELRAQVEEFDAAVSAAHEVSRRVREVIAS